MRVLIVGAGIGGLALAAHLWHDGHDVTVIEKNDTWEQPAQTITLWPAALAVLNLREHLAEVGLRPTGETLRDQSGRFCTRLDYHNLIERYGPVGLLTRYALHQTLRALAQEVPLYRGTTVRALQQYPDRVDITLSDQTELSVDLLVGADGTASQIRELLFGSGMLRYTGTTFQTCLTPRVPGSPSEINDLFGPGRYVGIVPYDAAQQCVQFMTRTVLYQADTPAQRLIALKRRFEHFGWIIPELLEAIDDPQMVEQSDLAVIMLRHWHSGRIVLLGDAAHTFIPGFGAAMALEDAATLARELRRHNGKTVTEALRSFETRRQRRIGQVSHLSTMLLRFTMLQNPLLIRARTAALRHTPDVLTRYAISETLCTGGDK